VNGKFGETNDSMWKFVSGGTQIRLANGDNIQANLWGNFERFHSLFLAITSVGGVSRSNSRLGTSSSNSENRKWSLGKIFSWP